MFISRSTLERMQVEIAALQETVKIQSRCLLALKEAHNDVVRDLAAELGLRTDRSYYDGTFQLGLNGPDRFQHNETTTSELVRAKPPLGKRGR